MGNEFVKELLFSRSRGELNGSVPNMKKFSFPMCAGQRLLDDATIGLKATSKSPRSWIRIR